MAERAKLNASSVRVPAFCPLSAMNARELGSFQLPRVPDQLNVTCATVAELLKVSVGSASAAANSSVRLAEDRAVPRATHPFRLKMSMN